MDMDNAQIRWIVAGFMLSALAGCEVHVGHCKKDDAGDCVDLFPDDDGGGLDGGEDDDVDAADASHHDAGKSDAAAEDAGRDAGLSDGGRDAQAEALTLEDFCIAQYAKAVLWRDALEDYCGNHEVAARESFLQLSFAYPPGDAVGDCITKRTSSNVTYDGSRAQACADAFTAQFPEPPADFPDAGVDLSTYTSTVAHGAASLVQIADCRATFKGKLGRDKTCADSFECTDGLRCLTAPGDITTCQPALIGGVCLRSSDCADSYTCVGSDASGGKTCVKSDELPLAGNCQFSFECAQDRICNDSGKCAPPQPDVICPL
jgi:hypothetical protein